MWQGIGYIIPMIKKPIGGGGPPVVEDFIIRETSPYTGAGVEYAIQENVIAPDNKIKKESA
jgi:hypothetical protein